MSCTSCLSNNDIQTPDQISVPCTTPYFHKDTLTPPSSLISPPLEGGGPSTYAARNASLYNARPLLRDLQPCPSQDMKHLFVCASSRIKHYVQPFIRLLWDARSRPYVFMLREFFLNINYKKSTRTSSKYG